LARLVANLLFFDGLGSIFLLAINPDPLNLFGFVLLRQISAFLQLLSHYVPILMVLEWVLRTQHLLGTLHIISDIFILFLLWFFLRGLGTGSFEKILREYLV
jgi:hypothetical protein